jgi:methyl-accepting chemotaxis protein
MPQRSAALRVLPEDAEAPPAVVPQDRSAEVREFAVRAGSLGREAAAIAGALDDLSAESQRQRQSFETLGIEAQGLQQANTDICRVAAEADGRVGEVRSSMQRALADAQVLAQAVNQTQQGVVAVMQALEGVSAVARDIGAIAMQTRIVAFNASVEAVRAGTLGRGFGVVAEAVKDLAERVQSSSQHISTTIAALSERVEALGHNARGRDSGAGGAVDVAAQTFEREFGAVERSVQAMRQAAEGNVAACSRVLDSLQGLQQGAAASEQAAQHATAGAHALLKLSEELIELTADSGYETADTPYIAAVTDAARRIGERFEQAVASGELSLEDLGDSRYVPIPGSDPQQYLTRFVDFTDRVLPPIQEPILQLSPGVVFCAAVDRNGFLPTHNRKFSQPQGKDPLWNTAHCRNRRLFNDRAGLAAGRNRKPFLLQTYRRDMGGGQFVILKELAAPILVRGRHWGGLRLAYRFE